MKGELIPLYATAAKLNVPPPVLNECELWEIAAMFGVGLDETGNAERRFSEGGVDPNLAARIARGRGEEAAWVEVRSYSPSIA